MSRTNEEVRNEILKRAKEADKKNKKRKKIIYYSIPAAVCLIIAITAELNIFINKDNVSVLYPRAENDKAGSSLTEAYITDVQHNKAEKNDIISDCTAETEYKQSEAISDTAEIRLFKASAKNSDSDSFAEDELQHIDVVIDGSIVYRQLPIENYKEYGFKESLQKSDFGAFIGTVTETSGYDISVKSGSQEPALKDSYVYYYGKNNTSALIVKKNQYCSIFVFDSYADQNKTHSLKETYALYGAYSADDIAYLSYTVYGMEKDRYIETQKGCVKDRNKIDSFYKITSALVPFEINDPIAMTPGWLIEAQEDYNEHPENFIREDFNINIHFTNGTVLKNIGYKPYISTGYVTFMELLTPEQNKELRAALTAE